MPDIPINDNIDDVELSNTAIPPDFQKVELDQATKNKYQNRYGLNLWDRLRMTWRGETEAGRIIGMILDFAELVAPRWVARIRTELQYQKPTTMSWLINRLQERSTWRAIITAVTGLGFIAVPEGLRDTVIQTGVGLFVIVEFIMKEQGSEDAVNKTRNG